MRHAARLPPPPVFNNRCLVQLIAFFKLQMINHIFWCLRFLRWTLAYLADICMFLTFAVNSLRVRRRWQSANLIAKMFQKCIKHAAKIHTNSFRIHPKSTKMMPRSAPKATLGASRFHELPPKKFLVPFWSNLGELARHFVPSWAPRGSQNQAFWHQVALKSQKMTS